MDYLRADFCCQAIHVDDDIEYWFTGIRIEIGHTFAEFVNIIGEQLIGIRYSIIQIGHFVKCKTSAKKNTKLAKINPNEWLISIWEQHTSNIDCTYASTN